MFWGLIMESGKRYTQTVERAFHVSMACLEPNTADNENVSVMLVFDNREFILCNLNKHKAVQSQLDLNFQSGDRIAFMSSGKGRVHLTGYLLETDEEDDDMSTDDLITESSTIVASDSPKKSPGVKGTNKRKNEPSITKPESKKVKLEQESPGKSSSDEDDDDDDDDSVLGEDSDDLLDGNEEEDDDEEDEDEDEDDDEDESDEDSDDEMEELETSKSKILNVKKKDKQINKFSNESPQNKNKSPNEKQKNRSLIEKQQKNRTPNEKQQQQQQQQKNKTPNEKQAGNTPHQKTPGSQINGMTQQQQQSGKKNKKGMDTPKGAKTPGGETPGKKVLEGGVLVEDLKVGNGPVAKPGRQVSVYYTGRLKSNNKQFDSATGGAGFKFRLGRGEVIKGWDIGLNGMKVGGKRKVTCPAALAYGNKGSPPAIPPNSALVFEVELKAVN